MRSNTSVAGRLVHTYSAYTSSIQDPDAIGCSRWPGSACGLKVDGFIGRKGNLYTLVARLLDVRAFVAEARKDVRVCQAGSRRPVGDVVGSLARLWGSDEIRRADTVPSRHPVDACSNAPITPDARAVGCLRRTMVTRQRPWHRWSLAHQSVRQPRVCCCEAQACDNDLGDLGR
jgi:hypothetical protein